MVALVPAGGERKPSQIKTQTIRQTLVSDATVLIPLYVRCWFVHFATQPPLAISLGYRMACVITKTKAEQAPMTSTTAQSMSQCLPIAELLLILQRCRISFAHHLAQVMPQRFVSSEAMSPLPSAQGGNICTTSHWNSGGRSPLDPNRHTRTQDVEAP